MEDIGWVVGVALPWKLLLVPQLCILDNLSTPLLSCLLELFQLLLDDLALVELIAKHDVVIADSHLSVLLSWSHVCFVRRVDAVLVSESIVERAAVVCWIVDMLWKLLKDQLAFTQMVRLLLMNSMELYWLRNNTSVRFYRAQPYLWVAYRTTWRRDASILVGVLFQILHMRRLK